MANKKEDPSILRYCANALNPFVKDLEKSAKFVLKRNDIEDIHDVRVASRRISAVLDAFNDHLPNKQVKAWKKDIRAITKSFGKVRDIDVQLDLINKIHEGTTDSKLRPGLRRIKLRLEQKRQQRQEETTQKTRSMLEHPTIAEISGWVDSTLAADQTEDQFSFDLYQLGYKQIQNRLDEFLFYEVFIFDAQRVEELHAMRIKAKKLRYALEIFSELYKQETNFALKISKQAQDYLGEIHDCDVWINYLPNFMEKENQRIRAFYGYTRPFRRIRPGIEFFITDRQKERNRLYKAFLREWKEWKLKESWLNLRKVIFLTSFEKPSPEPAPESAASKKPAEKASRPEDMAGSDEENETTTQQ